MGFGRETPFPLPLPEPPRQPLPLPNEVAPSLIPRSAFLCQADEPIADYAAMDDVMQGESRRGEFFWGGSGKAPGISGDALVAEGWDEFGS